LMMWLRNQWPMSVYAKQSKTNQDPSISETLLILISGE
jgi:hypothetical protein